MTFLDDSYVDVAERIKTFKEKYPDGSLQSFAPPYVAEVGGQSFVVYSAAAYRTPDDERPGVGWAWEPVPGPTTFTRNSELQNAETSAWGRAIVALGFETKKIASADEVRARVDGHAAPSASSTDKQVTKAQHAKIGAVIKELTEAAPEQDWVANSRAWVKDQFGKSSRAELTTEEAGKLIDYLEGLRDLQKVPFG